MTIEEIAEVCHEVNRAYCESLGDNSQLKWKHAPTWAKESAKAGVRLHLNNPHLTPEDSHNSWLAEKSKNGWVYGEIKDPEKKTHPCFVRYGDLPADQKAKDSIFSQIVKSLSKYYEAGAFEAFDNAFKNQEKQPT